MMKTGTEKPLDRPKNASILRRHAKEKDPTVEDTSLRPVLEEIQHKRDKPDTEITFTMIRGRRRGVRRRREVALLAMPRCTVLLVDFRRRKLRGRVGGGILGSAKDRRR